MNLIFDIGFNVGKFTQACFDKHSNCRVVAVEANPELSRNAPFHILSNSKFTLLNKLVSDRTGEEVDFYMCHNSTGVSTASTEFMRNSRFTKGSKNLNENSVKWEDPIKVKSITIDEMINTHGTPDLIKIDVEGYELKVLKGLTKKAKCICFEWHEEQSDSMYEILNHLQKLGYAKFGVIGWFDEGDIFEKATFSNKGDPHLEYPKSFHELKDLDLHKLINPNRRVNYGMIFTK